MSNGSTLAWVSAPHRELLVDRVSNTVMLSLEDMRAALVQDGFAHVRAEDMRLALTQEGMSDWRGFADSWNDLGVDTYMADGGRYRRRRHAALSITAERIRRKSHQPHYQSRDYNALNGGLARWFEPVRDDIADHPALRAILRASFAIFDSATDPATRPDSWHVELHQFRIEASPGEAGKPTPEGLHRDGVDWVLVLLVRRENVASGKTTIHDLQRKKLGSFTLTAPMECALVDDGRVFHGVTPIEPLVPGLPAYRDVLVATFRRE
jgi:hypothetical protein